MDARRVLIFREVARAGSLSAAAQSLGWTQPAVGQHVRRLERDVGTALVLRSPRGVTLTEAGALLLEHADAVASRLDVAAEELGALTQLRRGRLRIAAFPSACATIVPAAMAHITTVAPDLELRLLELEPPEARAGVLAGEIDVAIVFAYPGGEDDAHRDLARVDMFDDPILAIVPHDHSAAPGPVSLERLAGERWVAGCERCRAYLLRLAAAHGFEPDVLHSTDDYVVVQQLVARAQGVALLPNMSLQAVRDDDVLALPVLGEPTRRIGLLHRIETTDSAPVKLARTAFTRTATAPPRADR